MKKLLNTLYVTDENAYLSLDGEAIVCSSEGKTPLKVPLVGLEAICCFSYLGCSPALMGKCAREGVGMSFLGPNGRFLARISGPVRGNVYTRKEQIEAFDAHALELVQNNIAAKLANTRFLVGRTIRDHQDGNVEALREFSRGLKEKIVSVYGCDDVDVLRGMEGDAARKYFEVFGNLIRNAEPVFIVRGRSKHPPLDAVNALLSFLYSMQTNDIVSALETVGLDAYIGFYHTLRSGRASLACDLVEEVRCIAERFAVTMINLRMLDAYDFEVQPTGAVYLNDSGRKKVLLKWQEKKRESFRHPVLGQKIQYGLLPFVQANLLAKYVRGEIAEYPPFLLR